MRVCTTGPNFQFYPTATNNNQQQQQQLSITGLEPNPAMWQYTQQAAEAAGLSQQQLQLVAADAQQMPFEGNSFDAAVVTLVGGWLASSVLWQLPGFVTAQQQLFC
jgi:precorrin-6B methylase 2